jgi:tetratricopeptide (TPR) repeat protein
LTQDAELYADADHIGIGLTGFGGSFHICSLFFSGEYEQAIALKQELLRKMHERMDLHDYVYGLDCVSFSLAHLGRWDQAVLAAEEAMAVAQQYYDDHFISYAAMGLCVVHTLKGDTRRSIEYGELAVEKARTPAGRAWAQIHLAWAWCRAGNTDKGVKLLADLLPLLRDINYLPSLLPAIMYLAEGYLLVGEHDKAMQTVEELLEVSTRCEARWYLAHAHSLLGEIALTANAAEATSHFDYAVDLFRDIRAENDLARAYSGIGRYHKQQGNMDQARKYLTDALEIFERLGTLIEPDKVRKELTELP